MTAWQIGVVKSEMTLIMIARGVLVSHTYTQVYPVSVVCADTGLSHNYQSIYSVMFQQKITSQSSLTFPLS